jgi:hypothetical protein
MPRGHHGYSVQLSEGRNDAAVLPLYRRIRSVFNAATLCESEGNWEPEMTAVTLRRALLPIVAALTVSVMPASAQMAPMGMGPAAGAGPAWPGNPPPCVAEFVKLRENVEKTGLAAKAAHEKNATREQMCKIIETFAAAEEKMVKYADGNAASCGIPVEAVKQMKGNHAHTVQIRKQVCSAGPAAAPAAPTLSEALGTNSSPTPAAKTGKGTFDTLTGNPLTTQ